MAIGCVSEYTQELKEQLDEAQKGYKSKYFEETWGELFREVMPEVERAIEERYIECLKENIENARNELKEKLIKEGREATPLERLDLEVVPSKEQCKEMWKIGKELGVKDGELVNFPTIYGTKGVEDISKLIRETMSVLYNSKMPREFWDVTAYDGIMLIDAKTARERGIPAGWGGFVHSAEVLIESPKFPATVDISLDKKTAEEISLTRVPKPSELKTKEIMPRILHIVLDEKGEIPHKGVPEDLPKEKVFLWGLAHETFHLNIYYDEEVGKSIGGPGPIDELIGLDNIDGQNEWDRARDTQAEKGSIAGYSFIPGDPFQKEEEFNAQCFAAWVTDYSKLCPEMKEFFDKYLSRF